MSLLVKESKIDFLAFSRKEKHPRVRMRLLGLAHVKDGVSYRKIAKMLKVSLLTVQNWVNKFKISGIEGLKEKTGKNRKTLFPRDKEEELEKLILEKQKERKGGRLVGTDIQKIVKSYFGVEYSLRATYKLLHRINFVWISSRSKHPKSDEKAQEDFKKNFKKKSVRDFT